MDYGSGMHTGYGEAFSSDMNYESILQHIKQLIRILPPGYREYLMYNCCVGLRSSEAIESVHLMHNKQSIFNTIFQCTKRCVGTL
jgi:hypothetical protein